MVSTFLYLLAAAESVLSMVPCLTYHFHKKCSLRKKSEHFTETEVSEEGQSKSLQAALQLIILLY